MRNPLNPVLKVILTLLVFSGSSVAAEPWQKANWVWDNPSDQSATPRHFRFSFEVAGDMKSARVWIDADDEHTCFINGEKVGGRPDWREAGKYDIKPKLQKGKNVVAIEAINTGGPGGMIAWIEIVSADGKTTTYGTDGQWAVSTDAAKDWAALNFNHSKWLHAQVTGPADLSPYNLTGRGAPQNEITSATKPLVDKYQSADDELKQFIVPDGFKIELLADEPLLINPVSLALDEKGRMFFGESHTYRYGPDGSPVKPFTNPIVMLDPLPEGKGYERVVVAEGFGDPCMGILVRGGKLWATSNEFLYQFDLGPDGKATNRKTLLTDRAKAWNPFGFFEIEWGPDGLLYMSIGDHEIKVDGPTNKGFGARGHSGAIVRMKPDGSDLELLTQGFRVPYAFEFDPFGQLWLLSNGEGNPNRYAKIIDGVDYHCFTRDVENEWLAGRRPLAPPVIERPRGAATSLLHYYGGAFPLDMQGAQLLINWGPHGFGRVNHTLDRYKTDEHGNVTGDAQQWLGCDDPHFRPTAVLVAPDGNLLIADWYGRDDESDKTGRVWKLSYTGKDAMSKSFDNGADRKMSEEDLALLLLDSPSHAEREQGMSTLLRLGSAAIPKLGAKAAEAKAPLGAASALWTLAQIDTPEAFITFARGADHSDWRVRRLAVLLAKRYHASNLHELASKLAGTGDLNVRLAASTALGSPAQVRTALVNVLIAGAAEEKNLRYEAALWMAKSAASGSFTELLKSKDENVRLTGLIAIDIALYEKLLSAPDALAALTGAITSPAGSEVTQLIDLVSAHRDRIPADQRKPIAGALQALLSHPDLHPAAIAKSVLLLRSLSPDAQIGGAAKSALEAISRGEVQLRTSEDLLAVFDLLAVQENPGFAIGMIDRSLRDGDDRVRNAAHAVAVKLAKSDPRVGQTVWKHLSDHGTNPFQRMELLATAGAISGDSVDEKAWQALLKDADPTFAHDAVRAWRRFKGNASLTSFLVGAAPALIQKDPTLKEDLAFTFAAIGVPPDETQSLQLPAVTPTTDPGFRDDVLKRPDEGDRSARMGRQVFARAGCIQCHSAGTDTKLGPPLAGIGATQTRDYLLESILEPSKVIKTGFETEVVQTTDGKTYSGLVHPEGDHLIIRTATAEDHVPLTKIKQRRVQKISIMPTGLEVSMSRAELGDVLAYLKSLKTAPKN